MHASLPFPSFLPSSYALDPAQVEKSTPIMPPPLPPLPQPLPPSPHHLRLLHPSIPPSIITKRGLGADQLWKGDMKGIGHIQGQPPRHVSSGLLGFSPPLPTDFEVGEGKGVGGREGRAGGGREERRREE